MRSDYEEYRDTGMVGAYQPERAVLREAEGGVDTLFRDTNHRLTPDGLACERGLYIRGRFYLVTSVFPLEAKSTPTDKPLSLIDADLSKEAHST